MDREAKHIMSSCLLLTSMAFMAVLITVLLSIWADTTSRSIRIFPYMVAWLFTIILFMIGNKLRKSLLIEDTKTILTVVKAYSSKGKRMVTDNG